MKYDYQDGTSVESNISDEGTRMGISPDAIAHVINVLTDLYSDPAGAAIRETSTNGDDAQKEAGVTTPLKVFLPTEFSPIFEVVDRGTGMTEHTLRHEFGQYGFSSKRDSNDFNGMLGLGCKAPLTYTPQFTVVSVKDGLKNTANIVRGEDGVGRVRIPEEFCNVPTDEPNGTTVQIPVIDTDTFSDKARSFYRFWEPGTVLINGEPHDSIWDAEDVFRLDDDVLLGPSTAVDNTDRVTIVMAGVPYQLDAQHSNQITSSLAYNTTVVARVPTGSVNIPGNREALTYTSKTEDLLSTLADYVRDATERRFRERINACLTASESMEVAAEARTILRNFKAEWQGHTVPTRLTVGGWRGGGGHVDSSFLMNCKGASNFWNVTAHDSHKGRRSSEIDTTTKTLVVTGYDLTSVSAVNKAKVQKWAENHGHTDIPLVIFRESKKPSLSVWLDSSDSIVYAPWDDVKDVNLPADMRKAAAPSRRSYSSRSSTAAPSDDLSEVREVTADGSYRVVSRERVQNADCPTVVIAPSDKTKNERASLQTRLYRWGIALIVVNKNRHDDAHDIFSSLYSLDEAEDLIERRIREEYDDLDIFAASYCREFRWSTGFRGATDTAKNLINRADIHERFSNDHRIKGIKAIVARVEEAKQAENEVGDFVRRARIHFDYDTPLPPYIKALREWKDSFHKQDRVNIDALLTRKMDAFSKAYPLFEALSSNSNRSDNLQEYANLLDRAENA